MVGMAAITDYLLCLNDTSCLTSFFFVYVFVLFLILPVLALKLAFGLLSKQVNK
jgi:hypothetical protein